MITPHVLMLTVPLSHNNEILKVTQALIFSVHIDEVELMLYKLRMHSATLLAYYKLLYVIKQT